MYFGTLGSTIRFRQISKLGITQEIRVQRVESFNWFDLGFGKGSEQISSVFCVHQKSNHLTIRIMNIQHTSVVDLKLMQLAAKTGDWFTVTAWQVHILVVVVSSDRNKATVYGFHLTSSSLATA